MTFDLAKDPKTAMNVALRAALDEAGIDRGSIEQNATDAVVVFTPKGRIATGSAILAVHAHLREMDVAITSTDVGPDGMVRIVFARAADGTTTPPATAPHHAVLDDWFIGHDGAAGILYGVVSGDSRGRWPDGTTIATSPLQSGTVARQGAVVHTLNTAYLLGAPRAEANIGDAEMMATALMGYPALAMRTRN